MFELIELRSNLLTGQEILPFLYRHSSVDWLNVIFVDILFSVKVQPMHCYNLSVYNHSLFYFRLASLR